jgi:hypothetical protein
MYHIVFSTASILTLNLLFLSKKKKKTLNLLYFILLKKIKSAYLFFYLRNLLPSNKT